MPVPIDAEKHLAITHAIEGEGSQIKATDDARPWNLGQRLGLSRSNDHKIQVAATAVVGGDSGGLGISEHEQFV